MNTTKHQQRGIGLIEVLVTIVVVSIGFLATAKMQIEGLRFSQNAYFQSQAYFLANDMIDRMRSNMQGVHDGDYNNRSTSPTATRPSCSDCTPSQVAQIDFYDWSAALYPLAGTVGFIPALQGGETPATGRVIQLSGEQYAIEMTWEEAFSGNNPQQRLRIQFQLESQGT